MKNNNLIKVVFPFIALALLIGCVTQKAVNTTTAVDLNSKIASGQFFQRVNTFEVIFDSTLSMGETYKGGTKMKQEKDLLSLFDRTIPNLKLTAAERVFGQFTRFGEATTKLLYGPTDYSKSTLTSAVSTMEANGFSPFDMAIDGATADLQSQSGQLAVIAFSDGEDMEKFTPVAAAQRMKSAYGDRVCIYTVHLGENADGRKLMQQVADAGRCGFMVTGESIYTTAGMADFVEKVFLETKLEGLMRRSTKEPVPSPSTAAVMEEAKKAPEAASEVEKKIIEKGRATLLVEFDFDKSLVKPKFDKEIEKLADVMKKYPDLSIVVEGHTDSIGGKQYNEKLSHRRAEAIRQVMVKKFNIDAKRIKTVGYGFSKPIAINATKEGRQQNRRAETAVEYMK